MNTSSRFSILHILPILLSAALVKGCNPAKPRHSTNPPRIVASFYPLYDFARSLGGTNFIITCLTPPGGDPHSTDASPPLARQVAESDLILMLGFGMDGWLERLAQHSPQIRTLKFSLGVTPMKSPTSSWTNSAENSHQHGHDHSHAKVDPHIWLDPVLAQDMVRRLASEMTAIAPHHKQSILQNQTVLLQDLRQLHQEFETGLSAVARKQVVTFHGAFAYLFKRYHIETVGVIELFPGDEPSAGYLRTLVDTMKSLNLKVIFAEPQLPDRPAQIIAQEIRGRVERLDPCETILPDAAHETYATRQRRNLQVLLKVLSEP